MGLRPLLAMLYRCSYVINVLNESLLLGFIYQAKVADGREVLSVSIIC